MNGKNNKEQNSIAVTCCLGVIITALSASQPVGVAKYLTLACGVLIIAISAIALLKSAKKSKK